MILPIDPNNPSCRLIKPQAKSATKPPQRLGQALKTIYLFSAVLFHLVVSISQIIPDMKERDRCTKALLSGNDFSSHHNEGPKWKSYDFASAFFFIVAASFLSYHCLKSDRNILATEYNRSRPGRHHVYSSWFSLNALNLVSCLTELIGSMLPVSESVTISVNDSCKVFQPVVDADYGLKQANFGALNKCFKESCDGVLPSRDMTDGMLPLLLGMVMGLIAIYYTCYSQGVGPRDRPCEEENLASKNNSFV